MDQHRSPISMEGYERGPLRVSELEVVKNRILSLIAENATLPEILLNITLAVERENTECLCSILLLDESHSKFVSCISNSLPEKYIKAFNGVTIGPNVGSCGTAAYIRERVIVEDIQQDPLWEGYKEIAAEHQLASCWSEPILLSDGTLVGTFGVYHREPKVPSSQDIDVLVSYAQLSSIAFERHHTQEKLRLSEAVFENSTEGMIVTDSCWNIKLVNPAFTAITGFSAGEVIGHDINQFISNRETTETLQYLQRKLAHEGKWQGILWEHKKDGSEYLKKTSICNIYNEASEVIRRVVLFSDVTLEKQQEEAVWQAAHYDLLTHLPNRRYFTEQLQQEISLARETGSRIAVLYIDLDHFKEVNDIAGHSIGDQMLVEVALRVKQRLQAGDTVARVGGDEFIILLPKIESLVSINRLSTDILHDIEQPYQMNGDQYSISASIGITFFPEDSSTLDGLINNADQAMYQAKNQGGSRFCYYSQQLHEAITNKSKLSKELRNSIARGELKVFYQPIVDLKTNTVVKGEALVRWFSPVHGEVSPAEFIPLAESSGYIDEISSFVLSAVSSQLKKWRLNVDDNFQVSVNISPNQLKTKAGLEQLLKNVDDERSYSGLCIEITEGLLLGASQEITDIFNQLHQLGIEIAIDDFGTGYSSLSYISRLKVDYLKIDRSFVKDLADQTSNYFLVEAIIAMAHKLGIKVIAEGVETTGQRDLLRMAGCDLVQGFLYSRAIPSDEFGLRLQNIYSIPAT